MYFYVYLICTKNNNNRLVSYVGYTNNIKNRIKKHSSKGAKFTRGKNWKLLFKKKFLTKSEAMKYEYMLKKDKMKRTILKKRFYNV